MNNLLLSTKTFWNRNGSTILTCIGGAGVIATTVMAVKATPKAVTLLEEAKKEKGEDLTKLEVVKVAGPVYIPSVITGVTTLACIFGANSLNKRQQAALMSAYALLDKSFKDYKNKVRDLYGNEAETKVIEEIAKDKYVAEEDSEDDDKELFFDEFSGRYFRSTMYDVQRAEYALNRDLVMRGYAYLNEFYEHLGLEPIDSGYNLGWSPGACLDYYWQEWLDFSHEKVTMDDGLECHIIRMWEEPIMDFENYC